jgi:hypothetical protein
MPNVGKASEDAHRMVTTHYCGLWRGGWPSRRRVSTHRTLAQLSSSRLKSRPNQRIENENGRLDFVERFSAHRLVVLAWGGKQRADPGSQMRHRRRCGSSKPITLPLAYGSSFADRRCCKARWSDLGDLKKAAHGQDDVEGSQSSQRSPFDPAMALGFRQAVDSLDPASPFVKTSTAGVDSLYPCSYTLGQHEQSTWHE